MIISKKRLQYIIDTYYDDVDEININEIIRDEHEGRERMVAEIEEEQHMNGFYAFQDTLDMYRMER
ncbi:MAG: hypothetical protein VZR27_12145 [Acutalibacteraceae bacterium]|nr:hypothetical protein [Acutalibacteraceae bacterium]